MESTINDDDHFSGWTDPVQHAQSSYPRLLIHVVPVAAIMLGSLPARKDRKKMSRD